MSLKNDIERRRAARATSGNIHHASSGNGGAVSEKREVPAAPPSFLRLAKRDKRCWLLPWACFQGVGYEPDAVSGDGTGNGIDKCERLRLVFMRHDVSVRGHNLGGVADAIGAFALRELCEILGKYQPATDAAATPAPVVLEIDVVTK
ncbi:hypothetical protein OH491_22350 [Termitidicoccus mucosus]|uniref:Uncharacterized protein n=1 Tax=Termitidicoccus mucosus TaxID=1184151 RepID=A0A178IMY7_9BACT|nr:hypothetical protein AW736_04125 [Opitutaceae bacterium TSB47]